MIKELHSIPKGKYCCDKSGHCWYLKVFWKDGMINIKANSYYCFVYGINWDSTIKDKPVKCSECLTDFPEGARVIAVGML